jgi:hypothetical protein
MSGLTDREKIDKWIVNERIVSNEVLTIRLKYEDGEISDFSWKSVGEVEFQNSTRCLEFYKNNAERIYGCEITKIATAIDFYNQFTS